ncbi:hypothetical protein E3J51_04200 [Candidatus Bathyarchaeota archaeon]|nr:MAG: hypothetical protein E3J51_04200 [Candidatus Bathyarchaeota archaeon]
MSISRVRKLLNKMLQSTLNKVRPRTPMVMKDNIESTTKAEGTSRKTRFFAYRLMGERINLFLPLFEDLETGLHRSRLRITLKPYVSLVILTSLFVTSAATILVFAILHFILQLQFFSSLLFGVGSGLVTSVSTVICFYVYPYYRADKIKRDLNDSMSFTASYLAILAGSGVSPDVMFRSLSKIPQRLAIIDESRTIVRDIELFGADIITALEHASERTPSERFKELLEGFIATIRSGGNLKSYLMIRSRQSIKSKRIALRKFSDTLGILSEFYVTLLIAGPLIFVVMLVVMAMLGGGGLGLMDPTLLLMLLTYIVIPIGSVIFIIILDAISPR